MNSNTIFMDISTDEVILSDWNEISISLARNDIEATLWRELVNIVKNHDLKNIIVLNWPGGFTNLRVWTLSLNVLNTVINNQIDFFSISKIELYKKTYDNWLLPSYWVIYIWQKRNVWLWDFEKNEKIWQFSFDELKNYEILNSNSIFLDEVFDEKYYPEWMGGYNKVRTIYNWWVTIEFNWNDLSYNINELNLNPVKSIAPNYMMDPNITLPSK